MFRHVQSVTYDDDAAGAIINLLGFQAPEHMEKSLLEE